MLSNERLRLAISALLAVVLWAYVVGAIDPNTTKRFQNVPVVIVGEEELSESGLSVAQEDELIADVILAGHRSDLVRMKKQDVVLTVDVTDAEEGTNEISLNVATKNNIRLERATPEVFTLTVVPSEEAEQPADGDSEDAE